ncbi:MAG: phosphoribosyl-AMP cyclohydrolase, partial [Desulfovibrio sp.]|nr:phosphoribosyl-AMP cyclohydrolase [Desulfovibrio sp.]
MDFSPSFKGGLLPAIAQDAVSGEVLMLAWMNEEAWELTLRTGQAHYFSRNRQKIWRKGETSGNTQNIKSVRLD